MDTGEVRRDKILTRPENWEEMVKKHEEREQELIQRALEKKKVETLNELESVAKQAIVTRALRANAKEFKPIKDHHIKINPENEEVKQLREQIISDLATSRIPQQAPKTSGGLKGRISSQGS